MFFYGLYAFSGESLNQAHDWLEKEFDIIFYEHDSAYQGGVYYIAGDKGNEHLVLKENIDLLDGEPDEIDYPHHKFLLYINRTPRPEFFKHILSACDSFKLLKSEGL